MLGKLVIISCLAVAYGRPGLDERVLVTSDSCPAVGHWLLPHEYDCTKFYYCEYGLKWETSRDCAPGTEFSYELQVCVHPAQSKCNLSGVPPTEPEPTTTTTTQATPVNPDVLPNGCPADIHIHQLLPHADCDKFYQCNFGEKVERDCAPGTHFNPVIQVCDWPLNAGCESSGGSGDSGNGDSGNGDGGNGDGGNGDGGNGDGGNEDSGNGDGGNGDGGNGDGGNGDGGNGDGGNEDGGNGDGGNGDGGNGDGGSGTLANGCPADFDVHQLLPHEDCGKFYYCVFGAKVERECPAGLHFNPVIQVCDWPWDAGCKSNGGSGDGGSGGGSNGDGGNGDGGNGDGDNGDGGNGDGGNGDGGNGDGGNGDGGNGDGGNGDGGSGTLANGCPADFDVHQLLPHEDCGKFYYCVFGAKVERECPAGLHFNPVIQVCDWPWDAGCKSNGGSGDGGNGDGGNGDGGNGDGGNGDGGNGDSGNGDGGNGDGGNGDGGNGDGGNGDGGNGDGGNGDGGNGDGGSGTLANGCPADFDVHQLLPHEDCGKFYYCVFGAKVERECPAGLHFNPIIQVCDWPWDAGCKSNGGSGDGGNGDGGNGDGGNGDGGNGDGGNGDGGNGDGGNGDGGNGDGGNGDGGNGDGGNGDGGNGDGGNGDGGSGTLANGCPADFDVHQLLPHEDCGKFYYCVFGAKVERECPAGLHFNPVIQVCDWPWDAGCKSNGGSGDGGSGGGSNGDGGNGDGGNGDGGNGDGGNGDSGNGDGGNGDGGNGDGGNGDGGNGDGGSGTLANGCFADFDVHQLLPHEDCGKFYYCVFGEKVERECPAGLHFNPVIQVCDWPWDAGCESNGGSGDGGNGDGGNGNGGNGDGGNGDGGNEDGGSEGDNSKCKQCNVLPWTHDTDCDKYWICEGKTAVLVTCSEGLHFNAKTSTCDFISNAICDRDEIQATAEARGINLFVPWDKANNEIKQLLVNHY